MFLRKEGTKHKINIKGTALEQVQSLKYLGPIINSENTSDTLDDEINERVGLAGRLFNSIRKPFLAKKNFKELKKAIVK